MSVQIEGRNILFNFADGRRADAYMIEVNEADRTSESFRQWLKSGSPSSRSLEFTAYYQQERKWLPQIVTIDAQAVVSIEYLQTVFGFTPSEIWSHKSSKAKEIIGDGVKASTPKKRKDSS